MYFIDFMWHRIIGTIGCSLYNIIHNSKNVSIKTWIGRIHTKVFIVVASREEKKNELGKSIKEVSKLLFLILNMKQIWENNIGLFLEFIYGFLLYFYGTFLYCKMEKQAKIRENIFLGEHKSYFSPVFYLIF